MINSYTQLYDTEVIDSFTLSADDIKKLEKYQQEILESFLYSEICPCCNAFTYYKHKCYTCKFEYRMIPTAIK